MKYIELPNFDVASDAAAAFKVLGKPVCHFNCGYCSCGVRYFAANMMGQQASHEL